MAGAFDRMADEVVRTEGVRRQTRRRRRPRDPHALAALQAGLEELRDGLRPADPQRLGALHDQTLRLGRIVQDLADLSAAESAALSLHPTDTDLAGIATAALAAQQAQLDAAGLRVRADLATSTPVHADADRLHQAVANLLSNAARYCRPGDQVSLSSSIDGRTAVLDIADTGPGIPADELPHVFDRLWRGQHARAVTGSGIGLAVVRELVTAHGGTVTARSPAGSGTTITIRLPLTSTPAPSGTERVQRRPQPRRRLVGHAFNSGRPVTDTMTCGSSACTSTASGPSARTTTLHGNSRPISRSASSARLASGGLHAPRITYGSSSASSFCRNVACTSISVSTPKPCSCNAARTRSTVDSNGPGTRIVMPYDMVPPFVTSLRAYPHGYMGRAWGAASGGLGPALERGQMTLGGLQQVRVDLGHVRCGQPVLRGAQVFDVGLLDRLAHPQRRGQVGLALGEQAVIGRLDRGIAEPAVRHPGRRIGQTVAVQQRPHDVRCCVSDPAIRSKIAASYRSPNATYRSWASFSSWPSRSALTAAAPSTSPWPRGHRRRCNRPAPYRCRRRSCRARLSRPRHSCPFPCHCDCRWRNRCPGPGWP